MLDRKDPLVSILIPNYNYGRYLRHCLDSVIAQTYTNIEVIIQDNASTDDSYEILLEYELKYIKGEIDTYINVGRNKYNVGSDRNSTICFSRSEGDFFMFLSSDDALKPEFVERCVGILKNNPSVGMVMTHREEIDENGVVRKTPPFFNKSFIVDGESQAAVFMMAGIAVPSQIMMRTDARRKMLRHRNYQLPVAGDWYNNFLFACVSDIGYIKEALCEYRVHSGNETSESEKKLQGVFEHFILVNAFDATAKSLGMEKPQKRYSEAVEKLGDMCLRYTYKMLINNEIVAAKKYLNLAIVLKETIVDDKRYNLLKEIVSIESKQERNAKLTAFGEEYVLERTISYDPPEGFIEI